MKGKPGRWSWALPPLSRRLLGPVACLLLAVSCSDGSSPFSTSPPPPGTHFSVSPIPVEAIARITALGYNNKVFPTAHTYWHTCDFDVVQQSSRPCVLERFPILAPGNGTVRHVNPAADGSISVEGPPGLVWTFGHVTPEPGLARGSTVQAGQRIATMYYTHSFDFGVTNYGVTHAYLTPSRFPEPARHGQHPIEQFPEPLRSELLTRVQSVSANRLGRLSQDLAGTASGAWFIEGSPMDNTPLEAGQDWRLLWLGRYVENDESPILHVGEPWAGMPDNLYLVVDPEHPSWEAITPSSGRLALRLWRMGSDARANLAQPAGTVLVEMPSSDRLRIEWFTSHDPVTEFTGAARLFER